MKPVIRNNDIAVGHTDCMGDPVIGTVISANKAKILGLDTCREADIVYFPPHCHPSGTRDHYIHPISSSVKHYVEGSLVCLDGDRVPVADDAGPDAFLVKSQDVSISN